MRGLRPWSGAVLQSMDAVRSLDPFTLALVALGAVALLVAAYAVVRFVRRPASSRLRKRLADVDAVSILMHPNPDPDAMACANAVGHLAEHFGADVNLLYSGEIRHQENRAFRTVLDLDFERIETAADIDDDHEVVLVDHNVPRGFDGASDVDPYIVVDHHPGDGTGRGFTDVRPEYGACASILAEYFDDLNAVHVPPDESEPEGSRLTLPATVATGLVYGILSDTKDLTNGCSAAEFEACSSLYPTLDEGLLDRIANPQVDAEVLDVKARAIMERDPRPPYAVSDVGSVSNLDAIPQAADELVHLEGVTAVVVLGDKNGTLHLSGRSRDDRVHMGRALDQAVEDIPMATAGGHARMGGGQLSIDHMAGLGPSNGLSREEFHDRLFAAMAGEE